MNVTHSRTLKQAAFVCSTVGKVQRNKDRQTERVHISTIRIREWTYWNGD